VFTDQHGRPLDQEWLSDEVWKPTLRKAEITERGHKLHSRDLHFSRARRVKILGG
jgi:hypothetical protein